MATVEPRRLRTVVPGRGSAGPGTRQNPRRVFLLALLGYLLVATGWALALPTNGTYDEEDHAIRGYAVASGQIYATDDTVLVPRSLLPEHVDCTWERGDPKSAACQVPVEDTALARTPSTAARYSPVYYLPVGLPLLASPDHTGIILARLVSALLSGLLLASAFAVAAWLGNRLLLAGLALATTPMVFNLAAAINPNGLEISAGVSLWVALLALLLSDRRSDRVPVPGDRVVPQLVLLATVSAALLITVRQLGPLLAAVSVLCCVLLAGRARTTALLRHPGTPRIGGALVAAATAGFLVWTATSRITSPAPAPLVAEPASMPLGEALHGILTVRLEFYAKQLIGQFSYGETPVPWWLLVGWYALVLGLVIPAALLATWRHRLVNLGLFAALVGLLAALELYFLPHSGWFSHSRYAMPAGVGLLLLPAFVPRLRALLSIPVPYPQTRRWTSAEGPPCRIASDLAGWFTRIAVAVTGLFHLAALAKVVSRFSNGPAAAVDPFTGQWQPATGPLVPLLAVLLGAGVLAGLTWHHTRGVARLEAGAGHPPTPTPKPTERACSGPSTGTTTPS